MRRLWSFALLVVGLAAYRTAHRPIFLGESDAMCGVFEPPSSLADYGLHVPALLVVLGAALDLLASFAPPRSEIPRAIAGRPTPHWIPVASPARMLLDSRLARSLAPTNYVVGLFVMAFGLVALAQEGEGARAAGGNYLAIAALLALCPARPGEPAHGA